MARYTKRFLAVGAAAAMAASLAACGGGGGSGGNDNGNGNGTASGTKGGTLYEYIRAAYDHTDPQRIYLGVEIGQFKRTVYRSLVNFPISTDPKTADTPVPDLATDTGTKSDHAKTWSFTIKKGVKWQDGKPITCEDFKYGASRVFATDVITGGPNYLLSYLDIPTDKKTGLPVYDGPYKKDGQKYFDKAIQCKGNTITYHFKKPWPDFPLAVAALNMMDPYRADKDHGNKSNYQIFSNGPYMLQGSWTKDGGGTFVRNPNYDPSTDSTKLRQAKPDKIVFDIGQTSETIYSKLISDSGQAQNAVTIQSAPPSVFPQLTGDVKNRSVNVESPFVDYLLPNFKKLKNPLVRKALYYATDVQGWINAGGGTRTYAWAHSIVNPSVHGYQPNPAFDAPESGDPAKAKKLLQQAGVKMPFPLTFIYESTATSDKQAAALKAGWDKAGFKTTLDGVANSDTYYTDIQKPSNPADVIWAGWGADWPSAITVTPPLFDSRPNGVGVEGATSNGQDYGNYKSDKVNSYIDKAQTATSLADQTKWLQKVDIQLGKDYAYIPLEIQKFNFVYGSNIRGFTTTPPSAMYPDLGPIAVAH